MEITAILAIIAEQWTIWAPALTAVVGIIVGIVSYGRKVKDGLHEISETSKGLKDETTVKELLAQLKAAQNDNQKLRRQNRELLDELRKVRTIREEEDI